MLNIFGNEKRSDRWWIIVDYCQKGSLEDLLDKIKAGKANELPAHNLWELVLQSLFAQEMMHLYGVVHRDLKPENIFISNSGCLRVGDFGLARLNSKATNWANKVIPNATRCGTPGYMAEELLKDMGSVRPDIDTHSIAIIVNEMVALHVKPGQFLWSDTRTAPNTPSMEKLREDEDIMSTLKKL